MAIGTLIKELLEKQNKTVNELSKEIDINMHSLYSIIQRDSDRIDINLLAKIANYLGVSLNHFVQTSYETENNISLNYVQEESSVYGGKILLSNRLEDLLKSNNLTSNQFADINNIPINSVHNLLNNIISEADIYTLLKISELYEISIQMLLTGRKLDRYNEFVDFEAHTNMKHQTTYDLPSFKNIGDRITHIRKCYSITEKEAILYSGLQTYQLKAIENNQINPPFNFLFIFSVTNNISLEWLLYGENIFDNFFSTLGISNDDSKLIIRLTRYFKELADNRKNDILNLADMWSKEE